MKDPPVDGRTRAAYRKRTERTAWAGNGQGRGARVSGGNHRYYACVQEGVDTAIEQVAARPKREIAKTHVCNLYVQSTGLIVSILILQINNVVQCSHDR